MSRTPAAEVNITADLLTALLRDQFPALAHLPITPLGHGWDNVMLKIGDTLVARMPRRAVAVALIDHEWQYVPLIAPALPIAVPRFIHRGEPGHGYPWPWLIIPWFAGGNADECLPLPDEGIRLAHFLRALHQTDDGIAPRNPHRDVTLAIREPTVLAGWDMIMHSGVDVPDAIRAIWADAIALPVPAVRVWLHGDLHYRNILIDAGRISAVIDWGDICAGDPATDLAAFWIMFESRAARDAALDAYAADSDLRRRAMGWAVSFATILLASGITDDARHAAAGRATMRRLAEDWAFAG